MIRNLLSLYRRVQYKLNKRSEIGILAVGGKCYHSPFEEDTNYGDVVHPCVRFIPEGYLGHKWWMVYTPYYAANDKGENPILCYGDSEDSEPPKHWVVAYQVQGQPSEGYNSDPALLYDNGKMYVMWRENLTKRCIENDYVRATFGAEILKNGIGEIFGPLVGATDLEEDAEVSPCFIKTRDGKFRCYAMHLRFHSPFIQKLPRLVKRGVSSITNVLDILGIWSQQKAFGYAIWESESLFKEFSYKETRKFINCNKLYRPWHLDVFEYEKEYYMLIQSNQCNADICLAKILENGSYRMFTTPLITGLDIKKVGIYKSTGGVVDGIFYLYYTAQDPDNRKLNKLYLVKQPFSELLKKLID